MNNLKELTEVKAFLDGYNNDLKYLVNIETDPDTNVAECIIHEPNSEPEIKQIRYTPFMYMKDLTAHKLTLYADRLEILENKKQQYGITITSLKTGNQKRLKEGYCYKISSSKSYNSIINFLKDGKVYPYEKARDENGHELKDDKGEPIYLYRNFFFAPKTNEQFLIATKSRLFKGIEEYKDIHKLTFDIETTGLKYQISRVFAIGVRDNRGFEHILEAEKLNDDEAESKLIQDFFNLIIYLRPAIVSGFNSEMFDFDYLLGRAKILKLDITKLQTTLKQGVHLKRRPNVSVKYGNTADKFTATEIWGISVIDIMHAAKKTAAVNSDLKETKLKYITKFEKISKPNRTYIKGDDNGIGKMYAQNNIYTTDSNNNYLEIPKKFQEIAYKFYKLQANKTKLTDEQYSKYKVQYSNENKPFVKWFIDNAVPEGKTIFITGKKLLKQYLLDDLWETEKVDELYNQSAFMLAKIVPTTYQRICTMGTAAIWNLLLTAWSYENDLAIPDSDIRESFSGGLSRCYKTGYSTNFMKIDYASLYPSIQLTYGVFPIFDITGIIKKMLLYMTTARNIYKRLASGDELKEEEIALLKEIDHQAYNKFINNELTDVDRAMFKVKQLPIKILNNSLYGALGSNISFNWSDNTCAARITCIGRIQLRHAIDWFTKYKCIALYAVTDGINFEIPEKTNILVTNEGQSIVDHYDDIEKMWSFNNKTGMSALIQKFNAEEFDYSASDDKNYISVDDDGHFLSCLNLARINYASLSLVKDKKNGGMKEKVKLTGNTIKSSVMPEYIEEFIDKGLDLILHGKGKEFVDYYYDYAEKLYYKQIPLKKIASRNRVKTTLLGYLKRGSDKNGKDKAKQAHMELLTEKRLNQANEIFDERRESIIADVVSKIKSEKKRNSFNAEEWEGFLSPEDKMSLVSNYLPPEPELDSIVYTINTGFLKSHGSSNKIIDKKTGVERYASTLIDSKDLLENPDMTGDYNVVRYLDAFNTRVSSLLIGFDPEVRETILSKIVKKTFKDEFGNKQTVEELSKTMYLPDQLILKNFDSDNYGESMFLEEKEVEFWNKSGFDPRLVWNGFSMKEDSKVYYELYENALKYLNDIMVDNKKPLIKSVNQKYYAGDYVLLKDGTTYNLAKFNGVYLEIVREKVNIPKTEFEIELDRKKAEEEERIKNLEILQAKETEENKRIKIVEAKRKKYYNEFKKKFNMPKEMTMEKLFTEIEGSTEILDTYIDSVENAMENEVEGYDPD